MFGNVYFAGWRNDFLRQKTVRSRAVTRRDHGAATLHFVREPSSAFVGIGSAQTSGNSSLSGVVSDPTGAVVPGATVEIHNPVSQFSRSTTTDGEGQFSFTNIPFNPYHLSVTAKGFGAYSQDVDVRSAVPLNLKVALQIQGSAKTSPSKPAPAI